MSRPDPLIRFLIKQRLTRDPEFPTSSHAFTCCDHNEITDEGPALVDFLVLTPDQPHAPADVFPRLRWGGQIILISEHAAPVAAAAREYAAWYAERFAHTDDRHYEGATHESPPWIIEQLPTTIKKHPLNLPFLPGKNVHYFTARKTALAEPGLATDRFTYNVYLARNPESAKINGPRGTNAWQVVKEVPSAERVLERLKQKFPDADLDTLKRRARKFTEKIFPVFLTRETAILKLLERDLPKHFRHKVPQVLSTEQDAQGYTRVLRLNWLRNGRGHSPPLTQLQFAKQSAELLAALHDKAKIMHLDLRLDNFVITPRGVGFVDFGSAVRVGEAFPEASLLSNLFGEMMRTSQIQRMLGKMADAGQVTSEEIKNSYHKVDKAVDFFYLAVQINNPHGNPDFRGLVDYDPDSKEAFELAALTAEILRPTDPQNAKFKSARQILHGIEEIEKRIG
jgi:hypothetical protein